jgi:hypothetical protein
MGKIVGIRGVAALATFIGIVFMLAAASGCGDVSDRVGGSGAVEDVAKVSSGLSTADFTDGSGTVRIRIKTCDWTPFGTSPRCAYCAVDSGWVRIGGGAEIGGSPSSARLKASLPFNGSSPPSFGSCTGNGSGGIRSAWVARSTGTSSHRLRAYVIGLQLTGLSASALESSVFVHESTSELVLQPNITVPTLSGSMLIGGGAEIVPPAGYTPSLPAGGNGYLTESRPLFDTGEWRGRAVYTNPPDGGLKVYSIGIHWCPTGWTDCLMNRLRSVVTGSSTGYHTASLASPFPWITTSVGALGVTNGSSSRYLADLIPFLGSDDGFTVRTKDQGTSVNATTTGYSLNMMSSAYGYWAFNAIRFNTAGTALFRPSTTPPPRLQQSTGNPDSAAHRWHLESLGGGQYRIRNGNPQQGTQCAYREGSTTNVRVATCGSGNEFRWTVVTDPNGTFKLRNVSAGQCLDNNNQGYATSNLVLKTCVSAYSNVQSLFLDAYSWPP